MNSGRNSNFEILRLVAIVMITAYHYVVHGVQDPAVSGDNVQYISSLWGKAGVNLFCLITGYMLIGKDEIKYNRLKSAEFQVLFYTLTGLLVGFLLHKEISIKDVIYSVIPVITEHYWYITAYFIIFIFSPYINKLIKTLDQKSFQRLLIICYVIWCLIPFFTLRENSGMYWNQFIWFIVMYMTGAYLKINRSHYSKKTYIYALVLSNILLVLSVFAIDWMTFFSEKATSYITYFRWSNSPLIVIICISMMRLADIARVRSIGWINFLASLVLGVYLFQENIFYQSICWQDLFNNSLPETTLNRILHVIISVTGVIVLGGLIDLIRLKVFQLIKITK